MFEQNIAMHVGAMNQLFIYIWYLAENFGYSKVVLLYEFLHFIFKNVHS